MKKLILAILAITFTNIAFCAEFDKLFHNATLRVSAGICGNGTDATAKIDSISEWQGWYGRRVNMSTLLYPAEITVSLIDSASGDTIYVDAMSPEWTKSPDGHTTATFLVPKPKKPFEISIGLYGDDVEKNIKHRLFNTCRVPISRDSLKNIRRINTAPRPYVILRKAKNPRSSINLAILSEGYTLGERDSFLSKARQIEAAMFSQPGFKDNADKFNVVAVFIPSADSGASIPSDSLWLDTNFRSHFDSYGYARVLAVPDTRTIWDVLPGIPVSDVIILANTARYGGSGTYGDYAIASVNIPNFKEIILHEFGHSFGWLADEYEGDYDLTYPSDFEPFEPNITTLHDFRKKWITLIESGEAGFIEGGGYQTKGIWRGCEHCLMRSLADGQFCPVCAQAITRLIEYRTTPAPSR